jgi:protein Tex
VESAEAALAGARDILAERVSDDAAARAFVRDLTRERGSWRAGRRAGRRGDLQVPGLLRLLRAAPHIPGHRVLAIRRGEAEGFLTARIARRRRRSSRGCERAS